MDDQLKLCDEQGYTFGYNDDVRLEQIYLIFVIATLHLPSPGKLGENDLTALINQDAERFFPVVVARFARAQSMSPALSEVVSLPP